MPKRGGLYMDLMEKRINAVKRRMYELGPMRPGSLSRQTHRAGVEGAARLAHESTFAGPA